MKKEEISPYRLLLIMALLHFISMYLLMYLMVNNFSNVLPNLNQVYMAGIMTLPMIFFGFLLMKKMYPNKRLNMIFLAISLILLIVFFFFIRQQVAISDKEFLQSMIPHHAGAILMCEKSSITDSGVLNLCQNITSSQEYEINWMKNKLNELGS